MKVPEWLIWIVATPVVIVGGFFAAVGLSRLPLERIAAPPPQQSPEVERQKEMARSIVVAPQSADSSDELPESSPEAAPEGTLRIRGSNRVGCATEARYERLMRFAVQDDNEAFKQEVLAGILEKDCTLFKENEPVYLSEGNPLGGRAKLRRPGDTVEYWAPFEAAK